MIARDWNNSNNNVSVPIILYFLVVVDAILHRIKK